jgi:hypothetical protein
LRVRRKGAYGIAVARILYWNVNNFSIRKIFDEGTPQEFQYSQDRLNHIVRQVIAPNAPDVFVLVEAFRRVREVGDQGMTVGGNTRVGFAMLLLADEIRHSLGPTWCLVPPVNIGNFGFQESVGVYYNCQTMQFTGPWIYCQPNAAVQINKACPPTAGNLTRIRNWKHDWLDELPNPNNPDPARRLNRTWGPGPGVNINEWQSAGQWEYYTAQNVRMNFPDPDNRSPFHVDFVETAAPNRRIRLFAVHTSPSTAVGATIKIGTIPEVNQFPANSVSVVIGDFNVDSFDQAQNRAYKGIGAGGYQVNPNLYQNYEMALDPWAGAFVALGRKAYCMTHLLPGNLATPFNNTGVPTDPQHNVYPRRGYMGGVNINTQGASDTGAIDNAFVHYTPGTLTLPRNTTIVNTIAGKPYTQQPAPPGVGVALTGGVGYASSLANPIPPGGVNPPVDPLGFGNWNNFGKVYSTSDHLALSVDV